LERGTDDYLVKPFAIEELVARLRALGRRPALTADVLRYGDLEYDQGAREISVRATRLPLSRGESIVLERFLRHPDRVVTKAQLGDSLHSLEQDYTDNSIQVHVHRVRRKMADLGADVTIRALRGLGYMAVRLAGGRAGAGE
jgi:two-component system response regulator QseB